jgi:hypothetical protein
MGEVRFPYGKPKPPNEAARKRVRELTIYDSDDPVSPLLTGPIRTIMANAQCGLFFLLGTIALMLVTVYRLTGG